MIANRHEAKSIPIYFEPTSLEIQELMAPGKGDKRYFSADGYGSGHRDCRFSSPQPMGIVNKGPLVLLMQAWSRFATQNRIQYWLLHGTLLGWHWNHTIMDFDEDIDIGMSLRTLDQVLMPLNGTVFEGQYLLDINAFYKKRQRSALNAIDAEFIDILGGYKIDITAFTVYFPPKFAAQNESIRAADGHQYAMDDIFPLLPSHIDGASTLVPNSAEKLLKHEYGMSALTNTNHRGFRFTGTRWVAANPTDPKHSKKCKLLGAMDLFANASVFFIPWEQRRMLSMQSSTDDVELNAQIAPQLQQVDVDNTISMNLGYEIRNHTLHVAEFNIQRGTHWCDAANLIRSREVTRNADIIFVNEADWGMSRSGNAHTARLLAKELGMNYAWGIEFLELTPGDSGETKMAHNAPDCPSGRRGIGWTGKQDALGFTGNAILSKWPLKNVTVLRLPGINRLFHSKPGQAITANGFEKRLGSRMALYATIDDIPGYEGVIHMGCFHLQMLWDKRFPKEWEALGKKTVSLMKQHQDDVMDSTRSVPFLLGGDGWAPPWCKDDVGFSLLHPYQGGDWICGRNVRDVKDFTRIKASGISDHDLFGLKVNLS